MDSPFFRVLGAIRDGSRAVGEMRTAAQQGRCFNCRIRRIVPPAKLCDTCGEAAATAGVHILAGFAEDGARTAGEVAHDALREFFTGKR